MSRYERGLDGEPKPVPVRQRIARLVGKFLTGKVGENSQQAHYDQGAGSTPVPPDVYPNPHIPKDALLAEQAKISMAQHELNRRTAQRALDTVHRFYRPEASIRYSSDRLREAGASEPDVRDFEEVYVGRANELLHEHPGPVIIAEEMRPNIGSDGHICNHCGGQFYGTSKIVATLKTEDYEITLDRYRGTGEEDAVRERNHPYISSRTTYSELDEHLLTTHYDTVDAAGVVTKILTIPSQFQMNPLGPDLEQPQYAAPRTSPPQAAV